MSPLKDKPGAKAPPRRREWTGNQGGQNGQNQIGQKIDGRVRKKSEPNKMPGDVSQSDVMRRAVEVIGDESEAMRWLGTPIRALDYTTPISLLHKQRGRKAVLTVLGQLEHGVL